MTADISFIPNAAETHADIFAAESSGNTAADRSFAGAGSAHEEQDRALLLLTKVHDRDLLNDTLFDFLQSIMILIENLLRLVKINIFRRLCLPGKAGHKIEIIIKHAGLLRIRALLLQTVQDFLRLGPRRFIHARLFDLLLEFLHIGHVLGMHLVQLILEVFHLFLNGCLAILILIFLFL